MEYFSQSVSETNICTREATEDMCLLRAQTHTQFQAPALEGEWSSFFLVPFFFLSLTFATRF